MRTPARVRMLRILAEHEHVAAVPTPVALKDLDGRGLPRAVGSQQREDLAPAHREIDVRHRGDATVRLAQSADHDRGVDGRFGVDQLLLCRSLHGIHYGVTSHGTDKRVGPPGLVNYFTSGIQLPGSRLPAWSH